jgi:hypothetical protein
MVCAVMSMISPYFILIISNVLYKKQFVRYVVYNNTENNVDEPY